MLHSYSSVVDDVNFKYILFDLLLTNGSHIDFL